MTTIVCDNCGGTDFYKESGYFFCNGCQLQSQEVQEYVHDDFIAETRGRTTKVQSKKSEQTESKITSWECYNYILVGLTDELINLGADKHLRYVTKMLWLRYLERLQVFRSGRDELPKVQAVRSAIDAEIVYGKLAKKKRKRNKSSSSETDTTDPSSAKQERIRRKRALVKAQYDEFTQKSQDTPSIHNETLTSLQTSSDKSSKKATAILYNCFAAREVNRIKRSRYHGRKHRHDFQHDLKCHRVTYNTLSHKYKRGPHMISLNKLYAILYLALLIVKDKIQLSDMFRFIHEGHLSFNVYSHFFPEEFSDKVLNFHNFAKHSMFISAHFRKITSEMSKFLHVHSYVCRPDLMELCERYCRELNLPDQICYSVKNILAHSGVRMSYHKRGLSVPNYEGRVVSIILFVVKFLFGLDGVTEFELGKYADILNGSEAVNPKMFNVVDWLKHIEYRDLVMTSEHFPTCCAADEEVGNVGLAYRILGKKEYPSQVKASAKDNYKQVLQTLKDDLDDPNYVDFPVTLTPFRDYTKVLPKDGYLEILSRDFSGERLEHILKPTLFLNMVNKGEDPEVVHGGANEDWVLETVTSTKHEDRRDLRKRRKLVTVELTLDRKRIVNNPEKNDSDSSDSECEISSDVFKDNFNRANVWVFYRHFMDLKRYGTGIVDQDLNLDLERIREDLSASSEGYPKHYHPYERFWMRTKIYLEHLSQKDCSTFFDKFPHTFRLVFKECQRIVQQTQQELLEEYQRTELMLIYRVNYRRRSKHGRATKNKLISKYLEKCTQLW